MRKQVLSPFLLILSLFINLTSVLADDGRVGDIQYSILSEKQLQELHGKEWELLRGQEVPSDSELKNFWTEAHLPDARGVFLRMANHGRPRDEGNPDGHLPIGTYRGDIFKRHDHSGWTGEDTPDHTHGHSHPGLYGNGGYDNGSKAGAIWHGAQTQGASTRHKHSIPHDGGEETRPRNITVNAFIKIKETPKATPAPRAEVQTQWTQEQITQLLNMPEFKNALADALQNARKNNK